MLLASTVTSNPDQLYSTATVIPVVRAAICTFLSLFEFAVLVGDRPAKGKMVNG